MCNCQCVTGLLGSFRDRICPSALIRNSVICKVEELTHYNFLSYHYNVIVQSLGNNLFSFFLTLQQLYCKVIPLRCRFTMEINCGVTVSECLFNLKAVEVMLGRTLKNQFDSESVQIIIYFCLPQFVLAVCFL